MSSDDDDFSISLVDIKKGAKSSTGRRPRASPAHESESDASASEADARRKTKKPLNRTKAPAAKSSQRSPIDISDDSSDESFEDARPKALPKKSKPAGTAAKTATKGSRAGGTDSHLVDLTKGSSPIRKGKPGGDLKTNRKSLSQPTASQPDNESAGSAAGEDDAASAASGRELQGGAAATGEASKKPRAARGSALPSSLPLMFPKTLRSNRTTALVQMEGEGCDLSGSNPSQ
jgi:hypothetical protein